MSVVEFAGLKAAYRTAVQECDATEVEYRNKAWSIIFSPASTFQLLIFPVPIAPKLLICC
jgi:hypothetical protein